ncbi:hypothetical protein COCON_G00072300 [Conger conger]|uniref:SERRATE/Ars2 N-terminal domain-containing protein n=1 Tax=Conger conger TaxID=82655 RepID=A0A9Q1DN16_CONCO|nr:hypothetical protein COCON_G00072300 [Conger conger]
MKNFKEFLLSLDDSVGETEAVKRYNEYKMDFRRQQMQDFFLAHKDEEWDDHGGDPYHGVRPAIRRRGPSYAPAALGPPGPPPHAAAPRHPHTGQARQHP